MTIATVGALLATFLVADSSTVATRNADRCQVREAAASEVAERRVACAGRASETIRVDGVLDEAAWQEGAAITGFQQLDPHEGMPASEESAVHLLYDDEALYVGAMLYDAAPDSIVTRLSRRDVFNEDTDAFVIYIDPYLDRRTGFFFGVTAAGTRLDGVLMNDDWSDDSWDGVWQAATRRDDRGWVVEIRIPYSQIRFHRRAVYTWGINFQRFIARKNEAAYLVYTPKGESGFVSRFVDLIGIEQIQPPRQVEAIPYVTAKAEYLDVDAGDPFNDGSRYVPGLGADFKVGLTSNLTLNATINPDFGQVEVDPAVVNLSDVETFFPEKRPFFIEGATVFSSFGFGGANDNWGFNFGTPDFFYTRRIGRAPQGSTPDADYTHTPEAARILGAAKLTGKIGSDWNVGTVQAVTGRSNADLYAEGRTFEAEVEPPAYYGVVRAQKEFNEGRQALGVLSTTTLRQFSDDRLRSELNREAYVLGLDGWTFLDRDKVWALTGWAGVSHVRGTPERMLDLQQSSLHYFQRPDATHVSLDSTTTALTGLSGRLALNKQSGHWYTNIAAGFISPGFDINDLGFQWSADIINAHAVVGYRWTEPRSFYRRINTFFSVFRSQDFGGNMTWGGIWGNTWMQLKNYYQGNIGWAINPRTTSNRLTRGGPLTRRPGGVEIFGNVFSDSRKAWVWSLGGFTYRSASGNEVGLRTGLEWKPAANVSVSLNPNVNWGNTPTQWVDVFDDPTAGATLGRRYVFAHLDQVTVSSEVRLNWTFTPDLSLQLFAQPLIATGDYTDYKQLDRPKTYSFIIFGEDGTTFDPATRLADPDGAGPAEAIELPDEDFTFKSLRGTAVLRWEFRPGSTLYAVWTQQREDDLDDGTFAFGEALDQLRRAPSNNIFMLKLTYWLSR